MSKMSFIGEMNTVLAIMALVYWCVDKDFGRYLLMGWSGNRVVNGLLKVAGWVLERRYIGFSTDVPMMTRITRLATGLLSYYAVSLVLNPLLKGWIPGAGGAILTCFIQMFHVAFFFPWCLKRLEREAAPR